MTDPVASEGVPDGIRISRLFWQDEIDELTSRVAAVIAENAALHQQLSKLSIGVRNACTILGGAIFLAEYDKPRLYEPALKVHDALRKLAEAVEAEIGGKQ